MSRRRGCSRPSCNMPAACATAGSPRASGCCRSSMSFPRTMQTDKAKPWRDPKNWPMVLPNLGRSITIERLVADYQRRPREGRGGRTALGLAASQCRDRPGAACRPLARHRLLARRRRPDAHARDAARALRGGDHRHRWRRRSTICSAWRCSAAAGDPRLAALDACLVPGGCARAPAGHRRAAARLRGATAI